MKKTARIGVVVGIELVDESDHLLILTSGGRIIRLSMAEISIIGRNTMGRHLVRMDEGERVVDVTRAEPNEISMDDDSEEEPDDPGADDS
jgi:DNA gyrase subunit A